MIETKKQFAETRKIEHIIIKLSPKEKYILDTYKKSAGIMNFSEWARIVLFREVDNKIESGEFTLF